MVIESTNPIESEDTGFLSLYRYIRLFVGFRPTRKFFTHMVTSPLKGIKF